MNFKLILPNAVKSISSKLSKMFSIEAVNLLKVEESIISAREKKDYVCSLCR
jgi:hypothetical protein